METPGNISQRAAAVRLVVMDVDGVLTDGKITYASDGVEIKAFNVKDGLGISLARRVGLECGIITARESAIVTRRAVELDIRHVLQNTKTKLPALEALTAQLGLEMAQVAYIGDDLPDLPCLERVGFAACPADAVDAVQAVAHMVASRRGGDGAVREIIDFILASKASPQGGGGEGTAPLQQ